jgi:homoserine dehydrogenase
VVRLIICGFGTVGRAVAELLEANRERLWREHGLNPRVVTTLNSKNGPAEKVIEETPADVVLEATPTSLKNPHPAIERLKAAFRTGKHVVCVNKGPLAVALPALRELADYNGVQFRFSGTVGGGTPVLDWGRTCANGDEVLGVQAILNGTTNYILTRMETGATFDQALAEAQQKGYAEADPSGDVDGWDAAAKLVIFANWVLGRRVTLSDVKIRGIRDVRPEPGKVVKLIAEANSELSVGPKEIPADSPLNVRGTLNAVSMKLRAGGDVTLVGRGAGGPETATSVLRDLISIWNLSWGGKHGSRH